MRALARTRSAMTAMLFCLLLGIAQGAGAEASRPTVEPQPEPEVPTLWLHDRYNNATQAEWRFMTIAPQDPWETRRGIMSIQGDQSRRSIGMTDPVRPWLVEEATAAKVHLWLDFTDQMLPVWEPLDPVTDGDPENVTDTATNDPRPGQAVLRVSLASAVENVLLAAAEQRWEFQDIPTGIHEVVLDLPLQRAWTWDQNETGSAINFEIEWEGARQSDYQIGPDVLFGSTQHPTRVELPTYPWNATHLQEVAQIQAFECRNLAIQGTPCTRIDDTGEGEDRTTPGLPALFVTATLGALVWNGRRERMS